LFASPHLLAAQLADTLLPVVVPALAAYSGESDQ